MMQVEAITKATESLPRRRTALSVKQRLFPSETHPYRHFERAIQEHLPPNATILDAGCGRSLELFDRFGKQASLFIGIDCYNPEPYGEDSKRIFVCGDVSHLAFKDNTFDLVVARSVIEHLEAPAGFYSEVRRVLKPGGFCIVLTPNLGDYSALISKLIPNAWHPWIVQRTEGRPTEDTFPTYYKSNTMRRISSLARNAGLTIYSNQYLGQYPCYLMFSLPVFLIGAAYEKIISRFHCLRFLRGWLLVVLRKSCRQSPCRPEPSFQ